MVNPKTTIGRSDLRCIAFTDEQIRANLLQSILPANTAADVVNLLTSMNSYTPGRDEELDKLAPSKVKPKDFAVAF